MSKSKLSVEKDNWQPKVLAVKEPRQDFCLMDNSADMHVYNNLMLMMDFIMETTKVRESMTDEVSPDCGIVQIRLTLKDGQERIIFNL